MTMCVKSETEDLEVQQNKFITWPNHIQRPGPYIFQRHIDPSQSDPGAAMWDSPDCQPRRRTGSAVDRGTLPLPEGQSIPFPRRCIRCLSRRRFPEVFPGIYCLLSKSCRRHRDIRTFPCMTSIYLWSGCQAVFLLRAGDSGNWFPHPVRLRWGR